MLRTGERLIALERDMVRLETVVERVVLNMEAERAASKESRQELWGSLRDLGSKMERSVTGLAEEMKKMAEKRDDEMKKMAEKRDAVDSQVLARQSQDQGAITAAKYILSILLAVAALTGAFRMGENRSHNRPALTNCCAGMLL